MRVGAGIALRHVAPSGGVRTLYSPLVQRDPYGTGACSGSKIGLTAEKASKRLAKMHEYFGDAVVLGYEPLLSIMTNHKKDKHVLAAAVESGAELIVTLNLRDFPESALAPFRVEARHPDAFLVALYDLNPQVVTHTLDAQASAIGRSISELLSTLQRITPDFAELICSQLRL